MIVKRKGKKESVEVLDEYGGGYRDGFGDVGVRLKEMSLSEGVYGIEVGVSGENVD